MLTPAQLDQMTPADQIALFDRMLTQLYGSTSLSANKRLAEALLVHEQTPYKWRAKPESMPRAILIAMDAMLNSQEHLRAQLANAIRADLAAVAEGLAETAARLEALARLVHARTDDLVTPPVAASAPEPEA